MTSRLVEATQRDLSRTAPSSTVMTDPSLLGTYARDRADTVVAGTPLAVVLVGDVADAAAVLRWCSANSVPVVPRGAGSGLSGGANAVDGAVSIVMDRLTGISGVDSAGLTATVQAGVLTGDLKAAVAARGLFYPPDPASAAICTIGGNIATNAGGLCCVKYGVTRDWVQRIDALLADGTPIRVGRNARKDVAGYDLGALLVGSEGTLAVITGATLRLRPAPAQPLTMVASFRSLDAAAGAVVAMTSTGPIPSMLEIMDAATLRAVEAFEPMGLDLDCAALLVIQSDAIDSADELSRLEAACQTAGADYTAVASDALEADMLLQVRRQAYPALERLGRTLLDDVAIPVPAMPALIRGIQEIASQHDLLIGVFGHAGDGNLHPTIVIPRGDAAAADRAGHAFADILDTALELDGTVTGEHGIGSLKTPWLQRSIGPVESALQQQIKQVFDPQGLLNPGKAITIDPNRG